MHSRLNWPGQAFLVVGLAGASSAAVAVGCFGPADTNPPRCYPYACAPETSPTGGSDGDGGSGAGGEGTGGAATDPQGFFETQVLPGLLESCTADGSGCHIAAGTGVNFLVAGNEYQSITEFVTSAGVPFIVKTPAASLLLTVPRDGVDHAGTALWDSGEPALEALEANVLAWLTLEAAELPEYPFVEVGPQAIAPGTNTFSLAASGEPGLEGASVVVFAEVIGSPPAQALSLTEARIYPASGHAVHIEDLAFAIYPPGVVDPGDALLDHSLAGDAVYAAPALLGEGAVLLTGWTDGARLALRFDELDELYADDQGQVYEPCQKPDLFVQALTTLAAAADPLDVAEACAAECHGGEAPDAQAAMNLSMLLEDPADLGFACAVVRQHVTPDNPSTPADELAASPIFVLTNPTPGAGVPHPYKFEGSQNQWQAFVEALTPWIAGE